MFKNLTKNLIYSTLDYSGINRLFRQKNGKSVLILTYHSVLPYSSRFDEFDYRNCVSTEAFDAQIKYLKKHYDLITLNEAVERLNENKLDNIHVVLTFDDGFKNNYDFALPVLLDNNTSAVFYLSTDFIGKQYMLWTEKVNDIILNTQKTKLKIHLDKLVDLDLSSIEKREKASVLVRTYLKFNSINEENRVLGEMTELTGYDNWAIKKDPDRYDFMTWDEVKKMHQAGMEIGSHTHTHTLLNMMDEQNSFDELSTSKKEIETNLNTDCNLFSYPNGDKGNFLDIHFEQLKKLGYSCATTQLKGYNKPGGNIFALNRMNITSKMTLPVFKAMVSGSYSLL
ncbi:MAG: hypothetical protein D8M58_13140 [Calditrichaeota bacterium]|nr:MAG: hypothetical protein DWQ03_13925 [Calditrichota bacterium]MBL1206345.1 hypothetical protein [Calditrichota bacterium]NOG46171.1 polysaccharide deacetylase family protein [Calditrichota bacterium]